MSKPEEVKKSGEKKVDFEKLEIGELTTPELIEGYEKFWREKEEAEKTPEALFKVVDFYKAFGEMKKAKEFFLKADREEDVGNRYLYMVDAQHRFAASYLPEPTEEELKAGPENFPMPSDQVAEITAVIELYEKGVEIGYQPSNVAIAKFREAGRYVDRNYAYAKQLFEEVVKFTKQYPEHKEKFPKAEEDLKRINEKIEAEKKNKSVNRLRNLLVTPAEAKALVEVELAKSGEKLLRMQDSKNARLIQKNLVTAALVTDSEWDDENGFAALPIPTTEMLNSEIEMEVSLQDQEYAKRALDLYGRGVARNEMPSKIALAKFSEIGVKGLVTRNFDYAKSVYEEAAKDPKNFPQALEDLKRINEKIAKQKADADHSPSATAANQGAAALQPAPTGRNNSIS